ncbi:MAG: superoxide dismutase family protein [Butyricicoccaceae bacterium]
MNADLFPFLKQTAPALRADIHGLEGYPDIQGTVLFYRTVKGVVLVWSISGLPKRTGCESSIFAFHIHNGKNCAEDIGTHYNPNDCPHPQHAGDLPPLFANDGFAWGAVLTNRFYIWEVIGKPIIIHLNPDDFTTQPAGNSGEKIACGMIRRV